MPKEIKADDDASNKDNNNVSIIGLRSSTRSSRSNNATTNNNSSKETSKDVSAKASDSEQKTNSPRSSRLVKDNSPKTKKKTTDVSDAAAVPGGETTEDNDNKDNKSTTDNKNDKHSNSNSGKKTGDVDDSTSPQVTARAVGAAACGGRASPSLGIEVNMTNVDTTINNSSNNNNNNRPSSAASMHSNGSGHSVVGAGVGVPVGGGPSSSPISRATTATSRRGGRTRSRSPSATAMGRSPTSSPTSEAFPSMPATSNKDAASSGKEGKGGPGESSSSPSPTSSGQQQVSTSTGGPTSSQQPFGRSTPGTSSSSQQQSQPPPISPANPSAAAAAAAAAAKSLHRSHHQGPPPATWYGSDPHTGPSGRYGGGPPPGPSASGAGRSSSSRYSSGGPSLGPPPHLRAAPASYYDGSHHPAHLGPSSRPYYDSRPPSRGVGGPGPQAAADRYGYRPNSGGPGGGDPYSYRGGPGGGGRPPYGQGHGPPPPHHYDDYGRRPYGGPPQPPHQQPPGRPSSAAGGRTTPHGAAPRPGSAMSGTKDDVGSSSGASTPAKPTRRVIGTATPIHVPRAAAEPLTPSSKTTKASSSGSTDKANSSTSALSAPTEARRGSAASVFRRSNSGTIDEEKEENPQQQKILMALQSPSNSFEEKKSAQPDPASPRHSPELQRSPTSTPGGPPQQTSSLDMAPSFSLFNQSFDSLGDAGGFFNVSSTLGSALESTSFGGAGSLDDKVLTDLQLTASNGTFKLGASSSGGALTFGMSPTNSFGNGPTSASRSSNIFLLGGQDNRASSPSQVLDIYRTTSVSSPRAKKYDDDVGTGNLRLSGSLLASPSLGNYSMRGSFGADVPMMPQHQGYHPPPPLHHLSLYHRSSPYHHRPCRSTAPAPDGAPGFYVFLRKHREAFREITFLLPGLKSYVTKGHNHSNCKDEKNNTPRRKSRDHSPYDEPSEHESAIARRRIASAVCAFGGTFVGSRIGGPMADETHGRSNIATKVTGGSQSIFRNKRGEPAAVTPQSSESSSDRVNDRILSRQRAKYDDALPGRYYENDNRLSWEFEENPPVGQDNNDDDEYCNGRGSKRGGKGGSHDDKTSHDPNKKQKTEHDDHDDGSGDDGDGDGDDDGKKSGDKGKMKYRCKLCGQPKTDHVCPYKQSLVRNIGAMVYPAVNAFTASEPGKLAPSLADMNNFIGDLTGQPAMLSAENSPSRPTPDRLRRGLVTASSSSMAQVTPEALRSGTPRSSTASHGSESVTNTPQRNSRGLPGPANHHGPGNAHANKRSHRMMTGDFAMDQTDLLFVESTDLNPEQFRMVTQNKALVRDEAFTYPALPLPYAQRKRLSDNLFSLSKEIPQLTDECAAVLREARERDLWDLAVAELMTQVVIVVHCHDNDMVFEGLRRYLLSLGISC
jgi:hypothetical protein